MAAALVGAAALTAALLAGAPRLEQAASASSPTSQILRIAAPSNVSRAYGAGAADTKSSSRALS
jgi:hypothetical protein